MRRPRLPRIHRPRLPRVRRAERSPEEPTPPGAERRRRLPRLPRAVRRRLAARREKAQAQPSGARLPLRARPPFAQLAGLPIPTSLRTRTSLGLLAVIAVLLVVVLASTLGSPGGVEVSDAGAGGTPLIAGLPLLATKNTTRVAGGDPLTESAAVAVTVYPGGEERPRAVAVADAGDWRAALVASVLMSPPVRAPLILTDGHSMGAAGSAALARLRPAQVIRVGDPASPSGSRTLHLSGANPASMAASVAAYSMTQRTTADNRVMVVNSDAPAFAMAAAAWAAKSGDPILFVTRDTVPPETRDAIRALQQPRIYAIGPGTMIGRGAIGELRKLGRVKRVAGADPLATAVAFARYRDGDFGWGPIAPGRGLVVASAQQPLAGPAAAALSASGTYGALLLLGSSDGPLPPGVIQFLLDTQPGYASDPAHGVYNHAWVVGDGKVISVASQTRIDKLLEILPTR